MMKKIFQTLVIAGIATVMAAVPAFAEVGTWKQDGTGYWWQRSNGTYPINGWLWIDGNGDGTAECYHFDSRGYMDASKWIGNDYVDADGAWSDGTTKFTTRNPEDTLDQGDAPAQYQTNEFSVSQNLMGTYEMHTEMVDSYITIERDANGESWLNFYMTGHHEDGSSAEQSYRFYLQRVSDTHFVGDEYTYSGDMITFDWSEGMTYLKDVVLNGEGLSHYYRMQ